MKLAGVRCTRSGSAANAVHLFLPTIGPIMLVSKASTQHFPLLHWHITGLSNLALEVGVVPKALEVGSHDTDFLKGAVTHWHEGRCPHPNTIPHWSSLPRLG